MQIIPYIEKAKEIVDFSFANRTQATSELHEFNFLKESLDLLLVFIKQASGRKGVLAIANNIQLFHRCLRYALQEQKIFSRMDGKEIEDFRSKLNSFNNEIKNLDSQVISNNNNNSRRSDELDSGLKKLFEPKFEKLQEYFDSISLEDIKSLDEDTILNSARPEDRMLMELFIKKKLLPLSPSQEEVNIVKFNPVQTRKKEPFDFSDKLLSITSGTSNLPGKYNISELKEKQFNKSWHKLDFSKNSLVDKDFSFISKWVDYLFPNLKVLDISYNRIRGSDEMILKIIKKLEFLVLIGNPIATVDRIRFWESLTEEALSKIIWVERSWVESKAWKGMIPKPSCQEAVLIAHRNFYNSIDAKKLSQVCASTLKIAAYPDLEKKIARLNEWIVSLPYENDMKEKLKKQIKTLKLQENKTDKVETDGQKLYLKN